MRRNKRKKKSRSVSYYIPEEILINILARLPLKALLRVRSVSKSWCGLISSPSFVSTHLKRNVTELAHTYLITGPSPTQQVTQACYSLFSTETFEECLKLRHHLWTDERFRIYGSSNGLLCISDLVPRPSSPICIWNPCIRKCRTLPQRSFSRDCRGYSSYEISLSFGFHPELNDYKVVTMEWFVRSIMEVKVYSLSTDSWKTIEVIPPWLMFNPDWCVGCAFLNGLAYWLLRKSKKYWFVSFDTATEEFEELTVPDYISTKCWTRVEVYDQAICLPYSYLNPVASQQRQRHLDICVLQEKSFKKIPTAVLLLGIDDLPLGFSMQNELIVKQQAKGYEFDAGQIVLYDLETKLIKETGIGISRSYGYSAFAYIESLVLLDS